MGEKKHKSTLSNILYLGAMQITNYLVPILIIPILINRVGLEKYGLIALAQGVMNILVTITEYGTNLTGTRYISQEESNPSKLRGFVSQIISLRAFLLVVVFMVFALLVYLVPSWRTAYFLFLSSYLIVVAQAVFPIWYFQGIQKMQFITLINFLARILYIVAIWVFISSEDHYHYVNLINGICWIVTTGFGFTIMTSKIGLRNLKLSFHHVKQGLKENYPIFLSRIATTGYRNGVIVMAGFILGPTMLGVYSIIDKIVSLMATTNAVLFRALLPKASALAKKGVKPLRGYLLRVIRVVFPTAILASGSIFFLGEWVIQSLSGYFSKFEVIGGPYLPFLAVIPTLLVVNLPLGLSLIALQKNKQYFQYHFAALLAIVPLVLFLGTSYQLEGILTGVILAEMVMIFFGSALLARLNFFSEPN